jgi:hypothetical protein
MLALVLMDHALRHRAQCGEPKQSWRRVRRFRESVNPFESWHEEQRSAYVYQALAKFEPDPVKAGLFGKLANESLSQAEYWLREIERAGRPSPRFVPDWRARVVVKLTALFGVRAMRPILAAIKVRGLSVYNDDLAPHPRPTASSGIEHRHRGLGGGGICAPRCSGSMTASCPMRA